jgi:hypothetical protein
MQLIKIEIPEGIDTPYVNLNPETGICQISGKSYPENITAFYTRIINWFDEYSVFGDKDLTINMRMLYFNSSTQKAFTQIFEKLIGCDFKILVNWYYPADDEEILENGKILQSYADLKFKFYPY